MEFYSKHLEIRPDNPAVLFNRALCYKKMGDLEAALQGRGGGGGMARTWRGAGSWIPLT